MIRFSLLLQWMQLAALATNRKGCVDATFATQSLWNGGGTPDSRIVRPRRSYLYSFHPSVETIGTDPTTKPEYEKIIGPFGRYVDSVCMTIFRNKLRDQVLLSYLDNDGMADGRTSNATQNPILADSIYYGPVHYSQIVALAAALNARYTKPVGIQLRAHNVLKSMFPPWLPKLYKIFFSRPFPKFSAQMNSRVTAMLGVWLMGECTVNDILVPISEHPTKNSTSVTANINHQGVLVTRCRFLEESQCASVCINSCKIPTQNFFLQDMGIPLLMEPNYTTGSCQFSFGVLPNTTTETIGVSTPCLSRCPTAGSYRRNHLSGIGSSLIDRNVTSKCAMIMMD
jgi:Beta-carotene isomerase D27-like, C-terminal